MGGAAMMLRSRSSFTGARRGDVEAVNYVDFSSYAIDSILVDSPDWEIEITDNNPPLTNTTFVEIADSPFGRGFHVPMPNGTERQVINYVNLSAFVDGEVLALTKRSNVDKMDGPAIRATDSAYVSGRRNTENNITLRAYENGGSTRTTLVSQSKTISEAGWVFGRLRAEGSSIKLKVWEADLTLSDYGMSSEPSGWDIETTDTSIAGSGKVGVYAWLGNNAGDVECAWLSWSTDETPAIGPDSL